MYIELKDISKSIRKTEVLSNINLRLESGKVYGLKGKNGCGKTMLMRVICGLIKPTNGTVDYNGVVLWRDIDVPKSIGALIENPSFIPGYTGYENLELLSSIKGKTSEEEICDVMIKVGLEPYDKRKYRKYSLGMKQKLGIACAVMGEPEVIVLDEPINAIDEAGVELVRELLEELKKKDKLIIIACHDADEMNVLADEVIQMEKGHII
ncbi:MAG: ABC transporter ATP-binding protein [Lachnospiraceae bacterium]|nr:ABC transporter ATP-binding protein [Lachnospiraceae bacterium]